MHRDAICPTFIISGAQSVHMPWPWQKGSVSCSSTVWLSALIKLPLPFLVRQFPPASSDWSKAGVGQYNTSHPTSNSLIKILRLYLLFIYLIHYLFLFHKNREHLHFSLDSFQWCCGLLKGNSCYISSWCFHGLFTIQNEQAKNKTFLYFCENPVILYSPSNSNKTGSYWCSLYWMFTGLIHMWK